MPSLLRMPTPAAGVEEATLLEWSLDDGAAFARDDILFIIETDKAVIDVEAETDGVLHRKLVTGGRSVEVGTPVAVIGAAGDSAAEIDALVAEAGGAGRGAAGAGAAADVPAAGGAAGSGEVADVAAASGAVSGDGEYDAPLPDPLPAEPVAAADVTPAPGVAPAADGPAGSEPARGGRIFASPIARQMAKNAGLDIAALTGTGPDGRIVRRDVTAAIETGARPPAGSARRGIAEGVVIPAGTARDADTARGYTDEPHTRIRAAIAARLTQSKQSVPHFYVRATARVDALLALRAELNAEGGQKISVNDLLVRAVARAHRLLPAANAIFLDAAVRRFDYVDVAVAVSTDGGLVTPVLRDVDRMPISRIAAATVDLAMRARAGRLRQHELEGGSITVTNLGMYGTEEFDAIINPPHSAILAVGAARREPVVDESGELGVATVAHLVLSVDHRVLDGVVAAQWMGVLTGLVEHPARILA